MRRFCISYHDEHLVVYVLVGDRVALGISWRHGYQRVILDGELSVPLSHNDHWLGISIHLFGSRANTHKLDVVCHAQNLPASLSLDVLLGDVLGLVVKQAVRIARPGHATHVDFVTRLGARRHRRSMHDWRQI